MNLSTGAKPLLLLSGAAGRFGLKFVRKFGDVFDIIALVNVNSLPSHSGYSLFNPISETKESYPIRQVHCDLSSFEEVRRVVRDVCSLCGCPQYIINAAADTRFLGSTLDCDRFAEVALKQISVNSIAPALLTSIVFQECWRQISPAEQRASVVNISSVSGSHFYKGSHQASYAASKAALNMLTLYMASEYMPYKVLVNAILPNRFDTDEETSRIADVVKDILEGKKTGMILSI